MDLYVLLVVLVLVLVLEPSKPLQRLTSSKMPMDPPCCDRAMLSLSREVTAKLLPYLAAQPRTPELVGLVRQLIRIHPEFDKLMDLFVTN